MTDTTYVLWIKTREHPFWHIHSRQNRHRSLVDVLCGMRDRYTHSRILPEWMDPND